MAQHIGIGAHEHAHLAVKRCHPPECCVGACIIKLLDQAEFAVLGFLNKRERRIGGKRV